MLTDAVGRQWCYEEVHSFESTKNVYVTLPLSRHTQSQCKSVNSVFKWKPRLCFHVHLCTLWVWRNSHLGGMTQNKLRLTIGCLWNDLAVCCPNWLKTLWQPALIFEAVANEQHAAASLSGKGPAARKQGTMPSRMPDSVSMSDIPTKHPPPRCLPEPFPVSLHTNDEFKPNILHELIIHQYNVYMYILNWIVYGFLKHHFADAVRECTSNITQTTSLYPEVFVSQYFICPCYWCYSFVFIQEIPLSVFSYENKWWTTVNKVISYLKTSQWQKLWIQRQTQSNHENCIMPGTFLPLKHDWIIYWRKQKWGSNNSVPLHSSGCSNYDMGKNKAYCKIRHHNESHCLHRKVVSTDDWGLETQ